MLIWSFKSRVGGGGLCGLELVRALKALPGVQASVVCLAGSDMQRLAQAMGLYTHALPPKARLRKKAFANLLADLQPTLVVNPMLSLRQTPLLPMVLRSPAHYAFIVHEGRIRPGNAKLADRVGLIAQRWEAARADLCIALSQHTANEMADYVASEKLLTAVHPAFAAARQKSPTAPPATPPRILFFGRSNASKGINRLMAAFALLRQRMAVELDLCVQTEVAQRFAALDGVRCWSEYLSEEDLEARIQTADVVALPYENASQSGVAARAMGVGCPCVATPVGGLAEQVIHGQTGYVAANMTPAAFADAMYEVLANSDRYASLVRENLRLAKEERSWAAFAQSLLEALS